MDFLSHRKKFQILLDHKINQQLAVTCATECPHYIRFIWERRPNNTQQQPPLILNLNPHLWETLLKILLTYLLPILNTFWTYSLWLLLFLWLTLFWLYGEWKKMTLKLIISCTRIFQCKVCQKKKKGKMVGDLSTSSAIKQLTNSKQTIKWGADLKTCSLQTLNQTNMPLSPFLLISFELKSAASWTRHCLCFSLLNNSTWFS